MLITEQACLIILKYVLLYQKTASLLQTQQFLLLRSFKCAFLEIRY